MATATSWLGKLKKILSKTKGSKISRVEVEYDAGFGNQLYIRGEGASLDWERGILMTNTNADQWIWETNHPFHSCHFKILINDVQYEVGDNHTLTCGGILRCKPRF